MIYLGYLCATYRVPTICHIIVWIWPTVEEGGGGGGGGIFFIFFTEIIYLGYICATYRISTFCHVQVWSKSLCAVVWCGGAVVVW